MDDPWGSPWASTDTPSDTEPPPPSRADIFLSPPPKAFFGNGAPQSPWSTNHHDGGLSIWTSAGRVDDTENQNEWVTWVDSGMQPPRLSPRLNGSGKESPLAWPENAAASPALIANARSRTPSILRHHSPDPWATEFSLMDRSDIELPGSLKTPTGDTPTIGIVRVGEAPRLSHKVAGGGAEENTINQNISAGEKFAIRRKDYPTTSRDVADHTNTSSKLDLTTYELTSRPSSTCTIYSHDGLERQDSPITSIDEDRGARMQNSLRKTSGIVHEMIGIYDGLTRAASEEPPTLNRSGVSQTEPRRISLERSEIEDDDFGGEVGFGRFEDALTNDDRVTRRVDEAPSSQFSSTPIAEFKDVTTHRSHEEGKEDGVSSIEMAPVQPQSVVNKFRDVRFDTNPSFVDKMFPSLPDSLTDCSTEDREVSDYVVYDAFITISERKAWYRISRYGSMCKHDSGGDEDYHRVTWPTSQLHSDTIKIVRRWMEEDSYTGRATLGGTKRTGFFNWDSDAAPVELGEVFQRKSVAKHVRTSSIPINNTTIQPTSVDERPYRNSTGISLSPELQSTSRQIMPVSSFRWKSKSKEIPPTISFPHGSSSQNLTPAPVPTPTQTTFVDQDDDDWGEMVSSPRTTKDQLPLPNIPTQKVEPTIRLSLSVSDVDRHAGPKPPTSQDTQPIRSDSWSFPDVSALDKPNQVLNSSTTHPPQTEEIFTAFETNIPLPNQVSPKAPNWEVAIKNAIPRENTLTSRVGVNRTITSSSPLCSDKNQDDIVVQEILQNLPDLSYMFR
ncbi:hypothetical protein GGR58DRAFT_461732 [Xylaria digitata]|nr:hypothetical protein GGR58DRAFT_461732 [Xylaria digitata]